MKLLLDAGLPINWTDGVVTNKVSVVDWGANTGASTGCAGRLDVASVVGGDCGGILFVKDKKRGERYRGFRYGFVMRREEGSS